MPKKKKLWEEIPILISKNWLEVNNTLVAINEKIEKLEGHYNYRNNQIKYLESKYLLAYGKKFFMEDSELNDLARKITQNKAKANL